jgi:hypothetical protein
MKKLLSILCLAGMTYLGQAQGILFQSFETTKTAMPASWSENVIASAVTNKGWQFNNTYGTTMNSYIAPHTYCTFVDDYDNNWPAAKVNYDTLRTPVMNCSAYSHVFLCCDYNFWLDEGAETATLAISTNGGKTWTTAINFPNTDGGWADSSFFDISSYAAGQANVMAAFCYYDGYKTSYTYAATLMGIDNVDFYAPMSYDLSVSTQNQTAFLQAGSPYVFSGSINNFGTTTITSMDMNYSVNGGPVQTQTISGISGFAELTSYNWSLGSIPFTPPSPGMYTIKFWANNLNGANVDQNHSNDTLTETFMALSTLQAKTPLYEDVIGQSCYYCMLSAPNVDSVVANNPGKLNTLHYHVPYPTTPDYMWSVNQALATFYESYYSVSGTPTGMLDGVSLYPGALAAPQDLSSPNVRTEAAQGSPFSINITSFTYDPLTLMYNATATITSYGTFAAGLIARAAISNDSIIYTQDYSSDDPKSSFAPPTGTTTGGTPDYLYWYTMHFSSVVEDMMPSTAGTTLAAFTPTSSQNLTLSWKKNHAWSLTGKTYPYDSAGDRLTVFIQDPTGIPAMDIPAKYVYQSASIPATIVLGMQELTDGTSFNMYPNPTNKLTTLTYNLTKDQQVSIEVYNMLGEKVYSVDNGQMGAGDHTTSIDCSALQSGVYFVRMTTDGATTTRRLVIQQ